MGDGIRTFREVASQLASSKFEKYGEKKTLNDLEGNTLIIREFVEVERNDQKGPLFLVACETLNGKKTWFFTRAPWMAKYKDYVPFKAKISKRPAKTGEGNVFFFEEP
jgi:hypothetical protein